MLSFVIAKDYIGFAYNVIHCLVMIYCKFQTSRKLENRCFYMYVKWAMYFTIACQKLMNKFSFILSERKSNEFGECARDGGRCLAHSSCSMLYKNHPCS